MAAKASVVGPVPFKDVDTDTASAGRGKKELVPDQEHAEELVSTLPRGTLNGVKELRCYQGFWLLERYVAAAIGLQRLFEPRPDDVIVASFPKSGTTWVNALTFATMARRLYPPADARHPLLRLNPHQCLPFLEGLYSSGTHGKLEALPSPRLMNTHMPLCVLPPAATGTGTGCKVVYVCREPKDMVVSLWHYYKRVLPDLKLETTFDSLCEGGEMYGPVWDHILGYWRASAAVPDRVLFLRYEELLRDTAGNVRTLARFLGMPFSGAEEDAGVVGDIVRLCNFQHLQGLEANKTGFVGASKIPHDALFRNGVAGDWVNHMTPDMGRRLDQIVAAKMHTMALPFTDPILIPNFGFLSAVSHEGACELLWSSKERLPMIWH